MCRYHDDGFPYLQMGETKVTILPDGRMRLDCPAGIAIRHITLCPACGHLFTQDEKEREAL